jgi:hypothetical protein
MALPPGFLAIERIVHRAALVGRVIDPLTKSSIAGAAVEIVNAPAAFQARLAALRQGRPDARAELTATDASGGFRWLDLPAGDYALRVTVADVRYDAATATVSVPAGAPASIEIALAPTALTGTIRADQPAGPLAMARVRMPDSREQTFTAADGSFTLSPVEPGSARVIELSAQRYVTATRTVTLLRGRTTNLPAVTLLRS